MKTKRIALFFIMVMGIILTQSCEKDEENENETKISSYSSSESHNNGQNCMNCHVSGGKGEGWFVVAASVYDSTKTNPYPGATIKLYTGQNGTGTLKATIEVDQKGNFYTTASLDFGAGLYPTIVGKNSTQHMSSSTTTGQCNSCHSFNTDKIWTK